MGGAESGWGWKRARPVGLEGAWRGWGGKWAGRRREGGGAGQESVGRAVAAGRVAGPGR